MIFAFDEFELVSDAPELTRAGLPVKADPLVLSLLEVLVRNAGKLVTKQQLVTHVWGGRAVSENVITVSMVRLRKVLGHKAGTREFVNNVHGRGYRFVRPVTRRTASASQAPEAATAAVSPFVGREQVLASLRDALREAQNARGGLCLISGEAGIGKTRAVEVLERDAKAAGVPVLWGHCREAGDTPPLWPFAELVRAAVDQCSIELDHPRVAGLVPELARLLPELAESGPKVEVPSQPALKHKMFDAITRVLGQAGAQPCVLVLDDLHRADTASLELLRYWLDELSRTKLLLIATLRTADAAPGAAGQLAQIRGHRNTKRFTLERLEPEQVAKYLEEVLPKPSAEEVRAVIEKSEGNPYFMCELARQLAQPKQAEPARLTLPEAARGLLEHRVASLDRDAVDTLCCAAVIGRRFELSLLQAVTQRDAVELMACLDRARARELIRPDERSNTQFVFDHELLRETLYDMLPKSELRQCHVRVAEALEQRLHAGGSVSKGDLAYHFRAALPSGDLRRTIAYCAQAAKEAANLYAYSEAARHLKHARQTLDLLEHPSARLRLVLIMYEALCARVCCDPEAESLARAAVQLARAQQNGSSLAHAALLLDLNPGFPPWSGARDTYEEAASLLGPHEHTTRASMLARLATIAPLAYDAERSAEQVERALELAELGRDRIASYAARAAELHRFSGPGNEAREAASLRAFELLCEEHTFRLSVPPVLLELHRAIRALQGGDVASVHEALERARVAADKLGSREWLWHVDRFGAMMRVNLGGRDAADKLRALHRRAEREQLPATSLFVAYDRAVVLGEATNARRSELRHAFAHAPEDPPNIWSMKVRGLVAAGMHHEARAALELQPVAALAKLPCDREYLGTLGALARSSVELGALDYAEAIAGLLAPHADSFAVHVSLYCEGSIAQLLGRIWFALGRSAEASEQLERGIASEGERGLALCVREGRQTLASWHHEPG